MKETRKPAVDYLEKDRKHRDRTKKGRPDPKDTLHPVHEPYERDHFNWKRIADKLGEEDVD